MIKDATSSQSSHNFFHFAIVNSAAVKKLHQVISLVGNTVAKEAHCGTNALSVSCDGKRLVLIGPSATTVSVLEVETLNEV